MTDEKILELLKKVMTEFVEEIEDTNELLPIRFARLVQAETLAEVIPPQDIAAILLRSGPDTNPTVEFMFNNLQNAQWAHRQFIEARGLAMKSVLPVSSI